MATARPPMHGAMRLTSFAVLTQAATSRRRGLPGRERLSPRLRHGAAWAGTLLFEAALVVGTAGLLAVSTFVLR